MEYTTRKSLRFAPDEGAIAWIDRAVHEDWHDFNPLLGALVANEAHAGCGLVALSHDWLEEGMQCMVQVGDATPLKGQVRWIKGLGEGVVKLGIEYVDVE